MVIFARRMAESRKIQYLKDFSALIGRPRHMRKMGPINSLLSVCPSVCLSHLYLKNGSNDFLETLHDDLGR